MKSPTKSPAELLGPGRALTLANVAEGAEGLVVSDLARAVAARPKPPAVSLAAVGHFLAGELRFLDIPRVCRAVLSHHDFSASPALDELWAADRWARHEVHKWISAKCPTPT